MDINVEQEHKEQNVPIHFDKLSAQGMSHHTAGREGTKGIPTLLGSLIILLVATIAGSFLWWTGFSFEEPTPLTNDDTLKRLEEQRAIKDMQSAFVKVEELESDFLGAQWELATTSMFSEDETSQAIFYNNEFVHVAGRTYRALSSEVDEGMVVAELEARGYVYRLDIPKYDVSLSGMAADGPTGSLAGYLKYNPKDDTLQTIVISSKRYLNDMCIENGVEWYGEEVGQDGCEIESEFEIFVSWLETLPKLLGVQVSPSSNYYIYNDVLYFNSTRIGEADIETFEEINSHYAKDKNHVYSFGGVVITEADPYTFEILNDTYAKDKNRIYGLGGLNMAVDSLTFELIPRDYAKDKNAVYNLETREVLDYDPSTFESLKGSVQYYTDKNGIYCLESCTTKSCFGDSGTITEPVEDFKKSAVVHDDYFKSYVKAAGKVYAGCQLINDADPDTFEKLDGGYFKDKDFVYFGSEKIINADNNTFEVFIDYTCDIDGRRYAKDEELVYCGTEIINGADSETFEIIDEICDGGGYLQYAEYFSKDANFVYCGVERVDGVNPANCTADNLAGCEAQ